MYLQVIGQGLAELPGVDREVMRLHAPEVVTLLRQVRETRISLDPGQRLGLRHVGFGVDTVEDLFLAIRGRHRICHAGEKQARSRVEVVALGAEA